jgi:peroxiredoxin
MSSTKRSVRIGDPAPEFILQDAGGEMVRFSEYRGKRVLLFIWASTCFSRHQLSGWQSFYQKHREEGLELIGICLDVMGPQQASHFLEEAKVSFRNLFDPCGSVWDLLGIRMTPAGFYIDETCRVRYLKANNFEVSDSTTLKIMEDLVAEKWSKKIPKPPEKNLSSKKQEVADLTRQIKASSRLLGKRFRLAELFLFTGQPRKALKEVETIRSHNPRSLRSFYLEGVIHCYERRPDLAVVCWRRGLQLAPSNWILRRQLWAMESPMQFYPVINLEWQKEQLRLEELQASQRPQVKAQRR